MKNARYIVAAALLLAALFTAAAFAAPEQQAVYTDTWGVTGWYAGFMSTTDARGTLVDIRITADRGDYLESIVARCVTTECIARAVRLKPGTKVHASGFLIRYGEHELGRFAALLEKRK